MRTLAALCVVAVAASGARAQSLEGTLSPAIASARASVAGQKKLAQVSAAANGQAEGGDDELRRTLSDIAQRACAGGEIAPAELYALPARAGADFLGGSLPDGLSYASCAGKLYVRLGLKIVRGESVSMDDLTAQGSGEIPAVAAPVPAPAPVAPPAPAPSPAPAGPPPAIGAPSGPGAPATPPSGSDAEATARRSLERQNRELGKYDRIVHRADGERRRDRDRDRGRRR